MELKEKARNKFETLTNDEIYYLPEIDKFVLPNAIWNYKYQKKVLLKRNFTDFDFYDYDIEIIEDKSESIIEDKVEGIIKRKPKKN